MAVPVALVLLVACLVFAALAQGAGKDAAKFAGRGARRPTPRAADDSIFVCLVGKDSRALIERAERTVARAAVPSRVHVGVVAFVEAAPAHHAPPGGQITVLHRVSQRGDSLAEGRVVALKRVYRKERHVLLLHACDVAERWDEACLEALAEAGGAGAVVVALTTAEGAPAFPALKEKDGALDVAPVPFPADAAPAVTPSALWVHRLSFWDAATLAGSPPPETDSQVRYTRALRRHGLRLVVATRPLCEPGSRLGARLHPDGEGETLEAALTPEARAGVVDPTNRAELICKYGSADAGKVALRKARR